MQFCGFWEGFWGEVEVKGEGLKAGEKWLGVGQRMPGHEMWISGAWRGGGQVSRACYMVRGHVGGLGFVLSAREAVEGHSDF